MSNPCRWQPPPAPTDIVRIATSEISVAAIGLKIEAIAGLCNIAHFTYQLVQHLLDDQVYCFTPVPINFDMTLNPAVRDRFVVIVKSPLRIKGSIPV
jgi:hypothetical protein